MDESRYSDRRNQRLGTGSWLTDDFVFGITRGACPPRQRTSARVEREIFEAGKTFEETYPKYPFSELVRLSIALGQWLARASEKSRQRSAQAAASSHGGSSGYSQPFVHPVSSSQR